MYFDHPEPKTTEEFLPVSFNSPDIPPTFKLLNSSIVEFVAPTMNISYGLPITAAQSESEELLNLASPLILPIVTSLNRWTLLSLPSNVCLEYPEPKITA